MYAIAYLTYISPVYGLIIVSTANVFVTWEDTLPLKRVDDHAGACCTRSYTKGDPSCPVDVPLHVTISLTTANGLTLLSPPHQPPGCTHTHIHKTKVRSTMHRNTKVHFISLKVSWLFPFAIDALFVAKREQERTRFLCHQVQSVIEIAILCKVWCSDLVRAEGVTFSTPIKLYTET